MAKLIDLAGHKYGRLSIISRMPNGKNGNAFWLCKCDCGKNHKASSANLIKGKVKSCGCYFSEHVKLVNKKHGGRYMPEYNSWLSMKARCYNKNYDGYINHGARGIIVCDRWRNSFDDFIKDMGLKPSPKHTIDRYPNNDGDYEPGNCRWATKKEQSENRRNNVILEYNGDKKLQSQWAEELKTTGSEIIRQLKTKTFPEIVKFYKNKNSLTKQKTDNLFFVMNIN